MLSVSEGELVEVIDTSRNEWCLVRTASRDMLEGWVPAAYLKPYDMGGYCECVSVCLSDMGGYCECVSVCLSDMGGYSECVSVCLSDMGGYCECVSVCRYVSISVCFCQSVCLCLYMCF